MNKIFTLLVLSVLSTTIKAQQAPKYEPYGKVSQQDIEMTDCDFEKGANAEVLFDKGIFDEHGYLERHIRIKIFKVPGVKYASVRMRYFSYRDFSDIQGLKGETINYADGKIEITPLDKKQIFTERIDKYYSAIAFALPKVKPGSIIEYKYNVRSASPDWYFQNRIPTRYSEIKANFPPLLKIKYIPRVNRPFITDVGGPFDSYQNKVLINIPSLPDEPFMGSPENNLERMEFTGSIFETSWNKIGRDLMEYLDIGPQLNRKITDEDAIIKAAKNLKSDDEKISFIFNKVKDNMKWNDLTTYYTINGTSEAWDKETGNSAEINFILYHLLKKADINAYPMFVSTSDYPKLNPYNPNRYGLNNVIVYVPIDSTNIDNPKYYVLDATNKYNLFNEAPKDDLNTFGLCVDKKNFVSKTVFIENRVPIVQSVYLNAEISPNGKMNGTAEISDYGYNKSEVISHYKTDEEDKFKRYLSDNDNNLKIKSIKMEDMEVDSLPLTQKLSFTLDLTGADDNYLYFNSNLFVTPHKNPFVNENRYSDIDFGYQDNVSINGVFKIPGGYKVEALPQNMSMIMPDTSITVRRVINQQDDKIVVRYSIIRKRTLYSQKEYADFSLFFRKMFEMLNEQIVLKKS